MWRDLLLEELQDVGLEAESFNVVEGGVSVVDELGCLILWVQQDFAPLQ